MKMKYVRLSIVGILAFVSMILIFSEPTNEETWFCVLVWTKGLGLISGYASCRLFDRWDTENKLPDLNLKNN